MQARKQNRAPTDERTKGHRVFCWASTIPTHGIVAFPALRAVLPTSPVTIPREACEIAGLVEFNAKRQRRRDAKKGRHDARFFAAFC